MNPTLVFSIVFAFFQTNDRWMGFRGDGTSVTSAMGLPVRWSPSDGIAWKAAIPGYGQSNPLIWKNHVYVTSVDGQNKEMGLVTALDLQGGRVLWQKPFATSQKMKQGPMTSRAAPTGTVDDERVVALFLIRMILIMIVFQRILVRIIRINLIYIIL